MRNTRRARVVRGELNRRIPIAGHLDIDFVIFRGLVATEVYVVEKKRTDDAVALCRLHVRLKTSILVCLLRQQFSTGAILPVHAGRGRRYRSAPVVGGLAGGPYPPSELPSPLDFSCKCRACRGVGRVNVRCPHGSGNPSADYPLFFSPSCG